MISVIIPARDEPYLDKTIEDIFSKASGDIEVIVTLDGYWPNPPLKNRKNLIIIHRGQAQGMRPAINSAAAIASGEYIMKCDAHCMFAEGFDEVLVQDCEDDWLCIPRRYRLDADKWERKGDPIDYLYLTYPYSDDELYGTGFHGKKWIGTNKGKKEFYKKETENKDKLIDDIMTFQGSCWFLKKKKFFDIGCMSDEYYTSGQEAQELGFKVWLSGGRVIRNKKTWYAHWHKKKKGGAGYGLSKNRKKEGEAYSTDLWMNNKWDGQTRNIEWLVDKFWPIPGWPEEYGRRQSN